MTSINRELNTDRRIFKTKKAIYEALSVLLQKKSINSITVTELASAADINRKTFYRYYSTVNDVLDESINELVNSFRDLIIELSKDYDILAPQTLFAALNIIMTDADIAKNLFSSDNGDLLFNKLQNTLNETILKEFEKNEIKMTVPEDQYHFVSSFIAGGMVSVYREWISHPGKTSLDEMTHTLSTLIISGIHAVS